jgi:Response regulator containing a CheY-like receiver domain and an HD-GYP domain
MTKFTKQKKVLVVDDTPENIHVLVGILEDKYDVSVAASGEKALKIVSMVPDIDLILLDIMMPEMDGYEVCTRLKADMKTASIAVIFVTALAAEENEAKGLELGAVDYITKPFNPALVRARVKNHLELKNYRDRLEEMVREKTSELEITRDAMIESLGLLAENRHLETGSHIKRTMKYVRFLADKLKVHPRFKDFLSEEIIEYIEKSAPLHDIGKVGVPDNILMKPGKLTKEEFREMQRHAKIGHNALSYPDPRLESNAFLRLAREMAFTHHEKWDGTGYPRGLQGYEIPISGRLMAVADVYDAITTTRVYKSAQSHDEAVDEIRKCSGTAFDPEIVKIFLQYEKDFYRIVQELKNGG